MFYDDPIQHNNNEAKQHPQPGIFGTYTEMVMAITTPPYAFSINNNEAQPRKAELRNANMIIMQTIKTQTFIFLFLTVLNRRNIM